MKIKVFFIHETSVTRYINIENVEKLLAKSQRISFDTEIIQEFNANNLTSEMIKGKFSNNRITDNEHFARKQALFNNNKHISRNLKHHSALEKISKSSGYDHYLIIEDDVYFENDTILDDLEFLFTNLTNQTDSDVIFCGIPINAHESQKQLNEILQINYDSTPMSCESYIVKQSAAAKIIDAPFQHHMPMHIMYSCFKHSLKCGITNKQILIDGSKYGTFLSTIHDNSILPYNLINNDIIKKLNNNEIDIEQLKIQLDFKNHPSSLYILGNAFIKNEQYIQGNKVFLLAYDILLNNNCDINANNMIMKSLIDSFKYLQASS